MIDSETGTLALPAVVIPELDHLLGTRLGHAAQLALHDDIVEGVYLVVDLDSDRYQRVLDSTGVTPTSGWASSMLPWPP